MANKQRWKFSALAAAAVVTAGLYSADASALALGRVSVQSALGEPLRAEIELPQITAAEAESLRASPAKPEVFRAQGMEYTQTMNSLQVQLHRRSDGTAVLRLRNDRPVQEPFLDLVLDATWGSGHIVRSYTLLFDPPVTRRPAPAASAAPQISAPATMAAASPTPRVAAAAPARATEAVAPSSTPAPRTPAASRAADSVTVHSGDTAGRIASAHRPAGVSLDQMLVAMMRANPDAFIGGNVNRLKSGVVLQIPDQATAAATPSTEARQILSAQARDFNEFRRKMAGAAPTATVAAAQRSASGTVQARVDDNKPAGGTPDKLTLSKGEVKAGQTAEDQVAKDKQDSASAARMAELSKNISDLNNLGASSSGTGAGAAPAAAPIAVATNAVPATPTAPVAPATAAATEAAPSAAAIAPVDPASAATATDAAAVPAVTASEPVSAAPAEAVAPVEPPAPAPAPAPTPAPTPAAAPAEEPGFLSGLIEDPMVPLAGGGLLALLLGYGAYRVVQRRKQSTLVDSSFMESRSGPDSFFGASGGQRVNTADSSMTTGSSSMAYSPSQLDAGGDVDPVAEADVYLAYGRDTQAEDILKDALRQNPERVSISVKLAEIYSKRKDRKALESTAGDVYKLTQGQGPDWARVCALGEELDPLNPLYQPGGRPDMASADDALTPSSNFASTFSAAEAAISGAATLPPDLDLDLDLPDVLQDLPSTQPTPFAKPAAPVAAAATAGLAVAAASALASPPAAAKSSYEEITTLRPELEQPAALLMPEMPELPDLAPPSWNAAAPAADAPALPSTDGLSMAPSGLAPLTAHKLEDDPLEFDLGSLSLDLTAPSIPMPARAAPAVQEVSLEDGRAAAQEDPLSTKLSLAEEFNAIGDSEGARTLVEEVIAEATGELKTRAQRMLAELG